MKQQRYAPHGALALNPKAFGLIFESHEPEEPELADTGVVVITIRGPLMHRKDFWFDSYDAIKSRVADALELSPKMVVLAIDSPGGLVSGAFDTARELRKMVAAAGVDLYAHVDGQATSAAYALASAASWIGVSQTSMVGSIGVIDTMVDATLQNQMMGLNVQLIMSGARKADGNPNVPISEDALQASQVRVDTLAAMFFDLVAEDHGWGESTDALRTMQAGIVTGAEAIRVGLASQVATLEETIAFANPGNLRSGATTEKGENTMPEPMEDAIANLRKVAEGDDDEEAKKARAALAALGEGEPDDDKAQDDDDEDDEESQGDEDEDDDAKAQDEDDAKAQDDDDDDAKAKAEAAAGEVAQLHARVHKMEVDRKREKANIERRKLIASRPDFSKEMRASLRKADMATVRDLVKTLPKFSGRAEEVQDTVTPQVTRGDRQGDANVGHLHPDEKSALDVKMGLAEMTTETVHTPNRMSFGVARVATQKGK